MKKILILLIMMLFLTSCGQTNEIDSCGEREKLFYQKLHSIKDTYSLFEENNYVYTCGSFTYSFDNKIQSSKNIKYNGYTDIVTKSDGFYVKSNEFKYEIKTHNIINEKLEKYEYESSVCKNKNIYKNVEKTFASSNTSNGYEKIKDTYGSNEVYGVEFLLNFDNIIFNLKNYNKKQLNEMFDHIFYGDNDISLLKNEPIKFGDAICGMKKTLIVYSFNDNFKLTNILQTIDITYDKTKQEVIENKLQNSRVCSRLFKERLYNIEVNNDYNIIIEDKFLDVDLR